MSRAFPFAKSSEAVQAVKTLTTSWPSRTLRVVVDPAPQTFAERRSVLQALRQSGQIEVFRPIPHRAHDFMVVTNDDATATELTGTRSYTFSKASSNTDGQSSFRNAIDAAVTRTASVNVTQTTQDESDGTKRFEMEIASWPDYKHSKIIRGDPYTHEWPGNFKNNVTFRSLSLQKSIPKSAVKEGLTQWLWNPPTITDDKRKQQRLNVRDSLPGTWLAKKENRVLQKGQKEEGKQAGA